MSAKLEAFLTNFDIIKDKILQKEGRIDVDHLCACEDSKEPDKMVTDDTPSKRFRTVRCGDCFQASPSCEKCFLRSHEHHPFHWAERWNGRYYERVPQSALGRILYFGHGGKRCPTNYVNQKALKLSVVTMNGVHPCEAIYCTCASAGERWEQLLDESLFPGTIAAPETAIRLDVLKYFDTLCSASKVTAMDFVRTSRHTTNNAFPTSVPVCLTTSAQSSVSDYFSL